MAGHHCEHEGTIGELKANMENFTGWQNTQNGALVRLSEDSSGHRAALAATDQKVDGGFAAMNEKVDSGFEAIRDDIKSMPSSREIIVWISVIFAILLTIAEFVTSQVTGG